MLTMVKSEIDNKLWDIFLCDDEREKYWIKRPGEPFKCVNHYLKKKTLLAEWRTEKRWIGLAFKEFTRYLILDIDHKGDKASRYHNEADIKAIIGLFESYGILLNPFRSSPDGEGVHLVAFFVQRVKSLELAMLVRRVLEGAGYTIENGTLEIKPNLTKGGQVDKSTCRLPFQAGYAPLNEELFPVAQYPTANDREKALFWFLEYRYTDWDEVGRGSLAEMKAVSKAKKPPTLRLKYYEEGKVYYEGKSLTGKGERSGALKRILYYLDKSGIAGYTFEEERFTLAWNWLKSHHNGFSDTWNNEGWEKCKSELRGMVFGYYMANPEKSWARHLKRLGRLKQEPALKKIDCVVQYILDSEGAKGLSTNGSSVNISRLAQRFKDFRESARAEKTFALPGLTNEELRTTADKKTLEKHRGRIHDLWMAWEEAQG